MEYKMSNTIISGKLILNTYLDDSNLVLFIEGNKFPLMAELNINTNINDKFCKVEYYFGNNNSRQENDLVFNKLYGKVKIGYSRQAKIVHGNGIRPWGREPETFTIDNYDLLKELRQNINRYMILKIEIDSEKEEELRCKNLYDKAIKHFNELDNIARDLNITRRELISEVSKKIQKGEK